MNSNGSRINWQEVNSRLKQSQLALRNALVADEKRIQAIHRERAKRLATRKSVLSEPENQVAVLTFYLDKERYGIKIQHVVEVLKLSTYTPVPALPPEFLGIFNHRGLIKPILSLRCFLALPQTEIARARHTILLRKGRTEIGLEIDQLADVERILEENLRLPQSKEGDPLYRYLEGTTVNGLLVLNTDAIMAHCAFESQGPEI